MEVLDPYLLSVAVLATLGSGLIAGLLFAFSTAVMKGLLRISPDQGMKAMQHINVVILNPLFLGIFLGTALLSAALALNALLRWHAPGSIWMLAGAGCYLIGTFGVTIAVNVPLNNRLASADAAASESPSLWSAYVERWLRWNHLRTFLGAMATVFFTLAATHLRGPGP